VIRTYLRQIHRAARGAGLTEHQAEEVTQAVFVTFVETAHRFEGRSKVRTWLFGILYRKLQEARRGFAKERKHDDIDDVFESRFDETGHWSQPPVGADAFLEGEEVLGQIHDCLEETPERQRLAFTLREVEELETKEICKILDVTATNLGVMLFRARNRLRDCLEAKGIRR
jgi:RNA polymerase sigma-70 factor (ECF subfamily)